MIQAVLKGSDATAFISQTTNPVYSLIVRPEIKSFADLKGKVIGLSTPRRHHHAVDGAAPRRQGPQGRRHHRQGRGGHAGTLRLPQVG